METETTKDTTETLLDEVTTPTEEGREGEGAQDPINENVVEELKKLRAKNREILERAETAEAKLKEKEEGVTPIETQDLTTAIKQTLEQERAEAAKAERKGNFIAAINNYKETNPLFKTENDPEGTKFKAIEKELAGFNMSSANSVEEFNALLNKAAKLAGLESEVVVAKTVTTPTHSPVPGSQSAVTTDNSVSANISKEDIAIAAKHGMEPARFVELKNKYGFEGTFK